MINILVLSPVTDNITPAGFCIPGTQLFYNNTSPARSVQAGLQALYRCQATTNALNLKANCVTKTS
jgi:hypothetical protein